MPRKFLENKFYSSWLIFHYFFYSHKIFHGIYSYNKDTLEKFVSLNQSASEIKNKLEQLRALDNNMKINVAFAKFAPIGVDTIEDLEAVKKIMENKS